jgi:hypothetical protein
LFREVLKGETLVGIQTPSETRVFEPFENLSGVVGLGVEAEV